MIDFFNAQLYSNTSSNKILSEGSGSFVVAALPGAGETFSVATVPHDFGSSNLLYQVGINSTTPTAVIDPTILPWSSSDGRAILYARIDTDYLYVFCISSDNSGFGAPARTINYVYRILVP